MDHLLTKICSVGAAVLGLPRLLKDTDIETEYPSDVDDEYVTEEGYQPPPAGESTKLSAALALFRASRILGKVLEKLYPPGVTSYEISRQDQYSLETELQDWSNSLAAHLKLRFAQGKPAQGVVSSSSPILVCLLLQNANSSRWMLIHTQ